MTTRQHYRPSAPRPASRPVQRLRASGSDIAAQLVADIIHAKVEAKKQAEAAVREAVSRRRRRSRGWYFLFALPLLVGLTVWNLTRGARPPQVFSAEEREAAVRFRIYLAAQAVEAYRDSVGRWPPSLAAVGFGDAGFVYQARVRDYEISDTSSSVPLTYRRGDMVAPFAGAYRELQHGGIP